MTVKYNSHGSGFTSLKNAWNQNKFMKQYEQVNNPYFPFVYGNPVGYGSNTNADPFYWGQPQAPKYCACGESLKLGQETFCSQCEGSAAPRYRENENLAESSDSLSTTSQSVNNNTQNAITNNSIKAMSNEKIIRSIVDENIHYEKINEIFQ